MFKVSKYGSMYSGYHVLTHYLSVPMQHPGVMPNRMMMVPGMGQVIVGQQGQILPQGIEIFKNSLA